jgi:hydrogenase expression/formation protein HypC
MCLAIPMEVLEVEGNKAWVSAGGTKKEVRLDTVDEMPQVGDYLIVHAGFALRRIDEQEAKESIKLWEEMLGHEISG